LIALSLSSCGLISRPPEHEEDQAQLAVARARRLLSQQDFDGAVKENQRAITLARNRPPVDEALFHLGIIAATVANPKRDNKAAAGYFNRVIREYPQSPWMDQAKAWVGVLQANDKLVETLEKSKQVDIEIEEKRRQKERP
jgi:outer membrane protein assembly factor BamD (BamD/ComL family)